MESLSQGTDGCSIKDLRAVRDALEVLNGKWKLQILIAILSGTKRFKEIAREIDGISDRMLSKELKELETHQLVIRKVYDSFPPVVEYSATAHTYSLHTVIYALKEWGYLHREKILPPLKCLKTSIFLIKACYCIKKIINGLRQLKFSFEKKAKCILQISMM